MKIKFLLLLLLHPVIFTSYAQEKPASGLFTEGLVIQNGVMYGRNTFISDPQAGDIINGTFERPEEGMPAGKSPLGGDAVWTRITAGDEGYFSSPLLRGGALYVEYVSPEEKVMLLKASGHTMVFINGEPREGDHYDFNFSMQPVEVKEGINSFYFTNGRYPRIRAALEEVSADIMIKKKDLTLPDLIREETGFKWGGVTIINAGRKITGGLNIRCTVKETQLSTSLPTIERLTSRRVNFKIPLPSDLEEDECEVVIELFLKNDRLLDSYSFMLKVKDFAQNHDRTFISRIDGSVQYYSVTPGTRPKEKGQSLYLSVHGAGVQARNQAWTYDPKKDGHIVAPTNRGPFGFAWEDWGRLDALEVLEEGKKLFETAPEKTYLTGHSMGGHGTWYLGATYPDRFAAIAPCAGYPDLLNYASGDESGEQEGEMERMFARAGNPCRTLKIAPNYMHHGVYVYHGDADPTVSVEQARLMRRTLAGFHPDFSYYEYPGGTHWYGDISMDWPPIFDYFSLHEIPSPDEVRKLEFYSANPGVSASSNWVSIHQQIRPFEISSVKAVISSDSSVLSISTENILTLCIRPGDMSIVYPLTIDIDGQEMLIDSENKDSHYLRRSGEGKWLPSEKPSAGEKGPHRYGGFKDAFKNNMLFVYGTRGSSEENRWNFLKARFDAETFSYRGNGSIEIMTDSQFRDANFEGRNVILYGNADNNLAWEILLGESPVKVYDGRIVIGDRTITGDDIACYFIRPIKGSDNCSVGIIAGTGIRGMRTAYPNQYFIAGTAFPDLTVFRMPREGNGFDAVECAGFFGNDWSVTGGDFTW
ncbi:MAG: prolyl oligopeptidase family serine peptidase [Bacteroidales bacterium]|nr:prolyl oligopeptidase family serine peptidase [Bacteroidales bacterium]